MEGMACARRLSGTERYLLLVRTWKRYQASGKPYDVGKYRAGERAGVWRYYDQHGKLSRTRTY